MTEAHQGSNTGTGLETGETSACKELKGGQVGWHSAGAMLLTGQSNSPDNSLKEQLIP